MERLRENSGLRGAGIAGLDSAGRLRLLEERLEAMRRLREEGRPPVDGEMRRLAREIGMLSAGLLKEYGGMADEGMRARVLLAVMDAYEVTGKEGMLEEALGHAEALLPELADGALKCRLRSCCCYYAGAEECL